MIVDIVNCTKCSMCENQKPLLDIVDKCDIMWVGLSAKEVKDVFKEIPLSVSTLSGKLIHEIESEMEMYKFYKTNLVKCLPLDKKGKLRYPTKREIDLCITNLEKEIELLKPNIIVLLGNHVIESVGKSVNIVFEKFNDYEYKLYKHRNFYFMPIHHPSYISVYRRKYRSRYIGAVKDLIELNMLY